MLGVEFFFHCYLWIFFFCIELLRSIDCWVLERWGGGTPLVFWGSFSWRDRDTARMEAGKRTGVGAARNSLLLCVLEEDGWTCSFGKGIRCQCHNPARSCLSSAAGPAPRVPPGHPAVSSYRCRVPDTSRPPPQDFCSLLSSQLAAAKIPAGAPGSTSPGILWVEARPTSSRGSSAPALPTGSQRRPLPALAVTAPKERPAGREGSPWAPGPVYYPCCGCCFVCLVIRTSKELFIPIPVSLPQSPLVSKL